MCHAQMAAAAAADPVAGPGTDEKKQPAPLTLPAVQATLTSVLVNSRRWKLMKSSRLDSHFDLQTSESDWPHTHLTWRASVSKFELTRRLRPDAPVTLLGGRYLVALQMSGLNRISPYCFFHDGYASDPHFEYVMDTDCTISLFDTAGIVISAPQHSLTGALWQEVVDQNPRDLDFCIIDAKQDRHYLHGAVLRSRSAIARAKRDTGIGRSATGGTAPPAGWSEHHASDVSAEGVRYFLKALYSQHPYTEPWKIGTDLGSWRSLVDAHALWQELGVDELLTDPPLRWAASGNASVAGRAELVLLATEVSKSLPDCNPDMKTFTASLGYLADIGELLTALGSHMKLSNTGMIQLLRQAIPSDPPHPKHPAALDALELAHSAENTSGGGGGGGGGSSEAKRKAATDADKPASKKARVERAEVVEDQ